MTGNVSQDGWGSGLATGGIETGFRATRTEVYSSIVSGNLGSDIDFVNGYDNTFISRGFNLTGSGNATENFVATGDRRGISDPRLAPLADNGGSKLPGGSHLPTHALRLGSPAINAGHPNAQPGSDGVPLYDQRGEPFGRVSIGRIDVGAFELTEPSDLDLVVDTLADEMDDDYGSGDLSLREAIAISNLARSDGTIRFAPALTGGTIRLTMGDLRITDDVSIVGFDADSLTIDASGNDRTPDIKDGKGSRIFYIDTGRQPLIDVSISGMRLTGGDARTGAGAIDAYANLLLRDVRVDRNWTTGFGGGVYLIGSAVIEDSTFAENGAGRSGGAVFSTGPISISNCVIRDNTAGSSGGGMHIESRGANTIRQSTISGNSAGAGGGGLSSSRGTGMSIYDSTITGNTAARAGGLALGDDRTTIARCTIANNLASVDGGGITSGARVLEIRDSTIADNEAGNNGGGILRGGDELLLEQCTLSGNTAGMNGGGLHVAGVLRVVNSTLSGNAAGQSGGGAYIAVTTAATFAHSTVVANRADADAINGGLGGGMFIAQGPLALDHSIVAENLAKMVFGRDLTGFLTATISPRFSLIGTNAGTGLAGAPVLAPDANGNMIGAEPGAINPQLAPLAGNGGPTKTHALLAISPVINRGDPAAQPGLGGVPVSDQRGAPFTRIFGGRIDIGAFERQPTEFVLGDFNGSGVVDGADYALWRASEGENDQIAQLVDSRGNGDGKVDLWDRALWMINFGRKSEQSSPVAEAAPIAASNIRMSPLPRLHFSLLAAKSAPSARMETAGAGQSLEKKSIVPWASLAERTHQDLYSLDRAFATLL
jgi:parallel beta-helix repeat protein